MAKKVSSGARAKPKKADSPFDSAAQKQRDLRKDGFSAGEALKFTKRAFKPLTRQDKKEIAGVNRAFGSRKKRR